MTITKLSDGTIFKTLNDFLFESYTTIRTSSAMYTIEVEMNDNEMNELERCESSVTDAH